MTGVYSKRLASCASSSSSVIVAVPSQKLWVVKCVTFYNRTNGSTDNAAWGINEAGLVFVTGAPLQTYWRSVTWAGHMALVAGEHLLLAVNVGQWDILASGFEFSL